MAHIQSVFKSVFLRKRWFPSLFNRTHGRRRLSLDPNNFSVIYAIGDIHGCYTELLDAKRIIYADAEKYDGSVLLVLLGDYVDRGSRSKEVIEHISRAPSGRITQIALCGNHDDEFLRLIEEPRKFLNWRRFAGVETLNSYGIDAANLSRYGSPSEIGHVINDAIPIHHKTLLASLPSMLTVGDLVFVHAGIRPGVPLAKQDDADLLWIREPFLTQGPELPLSVVHGHTPVERPFFGNGRIAIDTGAFATGRLTVLRIANGQAVVLS